MSKKIFNLQDLSREELIAEINKLKSRKKFGLVFEDEPELTPLFIAEETLFLKGKIYTQESNFDFTPFQTSKGALRASIKKDKTGLFVYLGDRKFLNYQGVFYTLTQDTEENYLPTLKEKHFGKFDYNPLPEAPQNYLLEGDNLHTLQLLQATHQGLVDVIYIDPPYNTGNQDFKYNDSFVAEEDGYRHSKWLSFMKKRLTLSKKLLTKEGVIAISIGDTEQANLKMLCTDIFGENNVEEIIWEKVGDGNASAGKMKTTHRIRIEHEYIIFCYKNKLDTVFNKFMGMPDFKNKGTNPDKDIRGVYKAGNISKIEAKSLPTGKNYYSVVSPSGKVTTRQWHFNKEEFNRLDGEKRIYWGLDGENVPSLKIFLNEEREMTPTSILQGLGSLSSAKNELMGILGNNDLVKDFTPKPLSLIKHLLQIMSKKDSIVLDFFAGSGTTGQAVLELNKKDGGSRQFILCTNNEADICEMITYQRLSRLNAPHYAGLEIEPLPHNLSYKKVIGMDVSDMDEVTSNIVELVKLKEGCEVEIKNNNQLLVFESNSKAIVFKINEEADDIESFISSNSNFPKELIVYYDGIEGELDSDMQGLVDKFPKIIIKYVPEKIVTKISGVKL